MKELSPDFIELIVLRATEGLDPDQEARRLALLRQKGLEHRPDFDLAAAAAANAFGLKAARDIALNAIGADLLHRRTMPTGRIKFA